jgi:TonB-linked SusC/RagA family outer membrane protein
MKKNNGLTLYEKIISRITVSCILFLFLSISASAGEADSNNTLLTLKLSNVTIRNLLQEIEKKSDYVFIFSDENLKDLNALVNVEVNSQPVNMVLTDIFKSTDLSYHINDRQITIIRKAEPGQQEKSLKISGAVIDKDALPMIGVTVQEIGTSNIVVTDMDGKFTMYNLTPGSTLRFTFIGYKPQEIKLNDQTSLTVTMEEDVLGLGEIVVIGYGTQKKESLIGAISTVKPATLQVNQSRSITNALAGQVVGIIAVQRSGEPGNDASDFWIRGISSFQSAGTTPLVLVDGIERSLNNISPEEIESFSLLKDATATAVYGVRGANGVILIQTKRGQLGKPSITLKTDYGISTPTQLPHFVNGAKYMEVMNVANKLSGNATDLYSPEAIEATRNGTDPDLYPNVNWLKEVTQDWVSNSRVTLDINGGSERLRYSLVGSYFNENGITVTDPKVEYDASNRLSRYNIRSNVDLDLTPSTVVNVSIGGYIVDKNTPGVSPTDIIYLAFKNTPIVHPVVYSNGQIPALTSQTNPWAASTQSGFISTYDNSVQSTFSVIQDIGKLYKPLDGLKAKGIFSFDAYSWSQFNRTKTPTTYFATGRDADGELLTSITNEGSNFLGFSKSSGGNRAMYIETQLSYSHKFADNHQVDGLILYNMRDYVDADATTSIASLPYRNQGIAARLSYSFRNTYFIESNFGYNGSENFKKGKRWGFFPSIAAGWIISSEPFMAGTKDILSKLKIRGSYGLVGNDQLSGRRFPYISTITSGSGYTFGVGGDQSYTGYAESDFGVDLSWETVKKADLGLEVGLWGAVNIQADYFHERREDIFMQRKIIPETTGFTSNPWANFGVVENQGFESSLEINKNFGKDFFISIRGNFTYAKNKIIEYDEAESLKKTTRSRTGQSVNRYYGLTAIDLFQEEDFAADGSLVNGIPEHSFGVVKPGDIRYDDTNKDGKIDSYDYHPIGKPSVPEIVYGFGFSVQYKNYDLSAFFQGAANYSVMIQGDMLIPGSGGGGLGNIYSNCDDRWDPANPYKEKVFWPRLSINKSANNMLYSTWWLKDASYIRLKNFEMGYSLPEQWQRKIAMRGARVFFRGTNLFTWSAFKMWDPEIGSSDGLQYPPMKVYSIGLQVTF